MDYYSSKTCWITGGGSGIGKALAENLAARGADVTISGRDREKLAKLSSSADNISAVELDVTDLDSWIKAVENFSARKKYVDLVIFSAGTCEYVDLPDYDPALFRRVMEVNFMGVVNGIQAVLPLIRNSSCGHIAAVTSSVAALPLPRAEAYGASKAAASYMLNSLRLGLRKEDIDISVVMPGFVESPMTDKNDFPMPFMISADKAAKIILKGLQKHKHEIFFPGRFTWPLRLLGSLPSAFQQIFTRRFTK